MEISRRLESIPMSGIRKMFDLAKPDSINLGLGEPDMDPPKRAVEAMAEASRAGFNKYGPTAGIMPLREAVAERYQTYGIEGENVMITPSGSTALLEVSQALIDPGDEALIPSPGFVIYGPHTTLAGGRSVEYRFTGKDFQPDIEDIKSKITERTKAIFVNNPSNPTGSVLSGDSFRAICDIADDHDITVISDEVYDSFVYEDKHRSFLSRLDTSIVVGGFSKMMAVTGWRMGFLIADKSVMDAMVKMQYHVCASPNMPAMYGLLAALPGIDDYLETARSVFRKRRDLIVKRINGIDGMSIEPPKGAFYAFPSYDIDMKSTDLSLRLAENGLICSPGSAFGKYGEGHLRFSYAADESKIEKGMDILADIIGKLREGSL
ncbi:MAG: aminotransferase class I/II-fold pyridoxal phosphate-dependent enzyme [Candidatus Methanomethylophilaceae archaeon]|nr:aminotransferase class I/II-fold pyridoxal phosphate-dependent enzyme [Candidatus Methanomethylophilaceae archaeon]